MQGTGESQAQKDEVLEEEKVSKNPMRKTAFGLGPAGTLKEANCPTTTKLTHSS